MKTFLKDHWYELVLGIITLVPAIIFTFFKYNELVASLCWACSIFSIFIAVLRYAAERLDVLTDKIAQSEEES